MPAIFSSTYRLNPWMSETTTTKAVTPTIMPSKVSAERSLCAQIAATASFRVTTLSHKTGPQKSIERSDERARSLVLFPPQGVDRIQSRRFPRRPESKNDTHRSEERRVE